MAETKTKSGGSRRSTARRANGSRASRSASPRENGAVREIVTGKGPALAGGAAVLAGLAGAVALALNGRGRNRSLPDAIKKRKRKATRKALGATTKALGKTAVEVGKAGYRVGELTAEVRRIREQASRKS